jgi:hypothetical protein
MTQQNNGGPLLTDWFPSGVKPIHKGVYIRDIFCDPIDVHYAYFDGELWHSAVRKLDEARKQGESGLQEPKDDVFPTKWRGLAEKPD